MLCVVLNSCFDLNERKQELDTSYLGKINVAAVAKRSYANRLDFVVCTIKIEQKQKFILFISDLLIIYHPQ